LYKYEDLPKDIDQETMNVIWDLIDKDTLPDHLK
jgi:hypothetical protein